jgi:uncharacterized protein (DUF58 family)
MVFLVILVTSALWSALSILRVSLNRTTRTSRKQVGEIFTENYEVINRSFLPKIWLKVTDKSKLVGSSGSRVLTGIGGRQSRTYLAYTMLQQRGWFKLGPTQVESGDILGLFLLRKTFDTKMRLLVIPYMVDIQFFLAPLGILPGGYTLREKTLEVTPYAAGVREYVPGDPLKRIHWPSSARKQMLIVKEFEKDPLAEVSIFLDMRKSVHVKRENHAAINLDPIWWVNSPKTFKLPSDTAEYAISIAASVAKYYLRQKREVGLIVASQNYTALPAERGERQLGKILETLAVVQPEGDMPLWALVNSQVGHLARGSTVILITPATGKQILSITMDLIQRGLIPVFILIDPESFGGIGRSNDIANQLTNHGIFNYVIEEGDEIKSVLEAPMVINRNRKFSH